MQLADIQSLIDKEVAARSEEVWQRLLLCIRFGVRMTMEHQRTAGSNGCNCSYCSAIGRYVLLKRRVKRLYRQQEESTYAVGSSAWLEMNQAIVEAEHQLVAAVSRKNKVKEQKLEGELYIS